MLYAVTDEFEYVAVNFTVTSVGVCQLCLRRIGVRSQKSLKTAALTDSGVKKMLKTRFVSQDFFSLVNHCQMGTKV